jgi:radical SAM superfamily enzyme YgiQ (UPF0313 family)
MNKRYTPEDVRRTCGLFEEHGISVTGFLLLGGPGETRETVEESLAWLKTFKKHHQELIALLSSCARDGPVADIVPHSQPTRPHRCSVHPVLQAAQDCAKP